MPTTREMASGLRRAIVAMTAVAIDPKSDLEIGRLRAELPELRDLLDAAEAELVARFAEAEKALWVRVQQERTGVFADLEVFGVAVEIAPLRDSLIRWTPEHLHSMGLL